MADRQCKVETLPLLDVEFSGPTCRILRSSGLLGSKMPIATVKQLYRGLGRPAAGSLRDQSSARAPARTSLVSISGCRPSGVLVTAEITDIAANIAEEQVDQTLRTKLQEVFRPRTASLYSDRMAILPGLDEIELDDDRPTLIVLERPADMLPQDFVEWWNRQDLQNRVLVLTADPNAVATLRTSARRMRAIDKVEEHVKAQHGAESQQMTELQGVKGREAAGFTSALRETFKTIVFPTRQALRRVDDFRMEFDRNDYSGEQQIIDTLTKRGKFIPTDQFDAQFDTSGKMPRSSSLTPTRSSSPRFDAMPRCVRLGSGCRAVGLINLTRTAVQRGYWREKDGLVAKKWERRTRVTARLDDFAQLPWNPSRLEQRKGRVQRIGQVRDAVHILSLRYAGTVEDEVYATLSARFGDIFSVLGQLPDGFEDQWIDAVLRDRDAVKNFSQRVEKERPPMELRYMKDVADDRGLDWEYTERVLSSRDLDEWMRQGW